MRKVLIIDDEPRIRRGISHCIPWERMGIEPAGEAANGVEALEIIRAKRPDVVITDIRMPDMDGLDLMAMVRKEGIPCRFIIISGFAEFEYAQRALRYGASDYILKPVDEEKLLRSIEKCLREEDTGQEAGETEEDDGQKNLIVRKTLKIIENEYMNDLSLGEAAERVGVHPNYLSSLFSRSEGESFSSRLLRVRMRKAKELMDYSSMKVYEIADSVGYHDYRRFSKMFRQFYGVTPAEYRRGSGVPEEREPEEREPEEETQRR